MKGRFYVFVKMLPPKLSWGVLYAIFHALSLWRAFIPVLLESDLLGDRFHDIMVASSLSLLDRTFQNSYLKLII